MLEEEKEILIQSHFLKTNFQILLTQGTSADFRSKQLLLYVGYPFVMEMNLLIFLFCLKFLKNNEIWKYEQKVSLELRFILDLLLAALFQDFLQVNG